MREHRFEKEYLAVLHGIPQAENAVLQDLLLRSKEDRKTYVVSQPGKDVQEAALEYWMLACTDSLSKVRIRLITGRTHQIRAQFSSRGLPLVGDRKYSTLEDDCEIALWSHTLRFRHPYSGQPMEFTAEPPARYPWTAFQEDR